MKPAQLENATTRVLARSRRDRKKPVRRPRRSVISVRLQNALTTVHVNRSLLRIIKNVWKITRNAVALSAKRNVLDPDSGLMSARNVGLRIANTSVASPPKPAGKNVKRSVSVALRGNVQDRAATV